MIDLLFSNFYKFFFKLIKLIDFVIGICCDEWFFVVDEWFERKCLGWFFGILIVKVVEMGCDLVFIGLGGNSLDDKEWRILFVRVERFFIYLLNLM